MRGLSGTPEGAGTGAVGGGGPSQAEETARALAEKEKEKYIIFGWCDLRLLVLFALVVQNACQMLKRQFMFPVLSCFLVFPLLPFSGLS